MTVRTIPLNRALEAYQELNEDEELEFNKMTGLTYDIFSSSSRTNDVEKEVK